MYVKLIAHKNKVINTCRLSTTNFIIVYMDIIALF